MYKLKCKNVFNIKYINKMSGSGYQKIVDEMLRRGIDITKLGYDVKIKDVVNMTLAREVSNERKEYHDICYEQIEDELSSLETFGSCTSNDVDKEWIQENIDKINMKKLSKEVSEDFTNPNVMEATSCIADSLVFVRDISSETNQRLREWIHNFKKIGTASVSGSAFLAALENQETGKETGDIFVVKAPQNVNARRDLSHEIFAAVHGINSLRKYIPNFAYVYGYMYCSPPYTDTKTGKVNTWCTSERQQDSVLYAIYENIPCESIRKKCTTCTPEEFMSYYLQILLSLRMANKLIDFTHYDCHSENVVIRKNTDLDYIPYDSPDGYKIFVKANHGIATFIDYGSCHIKLRNKHYIDTSSNGLANFDHRPSNKSNPLHDAYKLLSFCIADMMDPLSKRHANVKALSEMIPLLKYFTKTESIYRFIVDHSNYVHSFPFESTSEDLDKFINFCLDYCDIMGYDIYKKTLPETNSVNNVLEKVGIPHDKSISKPDTIFQLYDTVSIYLEKLAKHNSGDEDEEYEDYDSLAKKSVLMLREFYPKLILSLDRFCSKSYYLFENVSKFQPPVLPDLKLTYEMEHIYNEDVLKQCQKVVNEGTSKFDLLDTCHTRLKVLSAITGYYKEDLELPSDPDYQRIISLMETEIVFLKEKRKILVSQVKEYLEAFTKIIHAFSPIIKRSEEDDDNYYLLLDDLNNSESDIDRKYRWYLSTSDMLEKIMPRMRELIDYKGFD